MSGIAGIIRYDGVPVEPGFVETMTTAMAHRGPDGIRHWVKGSVALGQCMLCTTSESFEENQPLSNEDGNLVLVMDGRVENWEDLRRELLGRGTLLRSHADAELVLRAYEVWGKDCLKRINGDFAFVIWDARRQDAFCARDRLGNKPFNYYWDGKIFVFASELHAILLLPWISQILNEGMLAEFLAMEWYSQEETFWQGILRLRAAHQMVVDGYGPRLAKYWEPDLWTTLPYTREEEYIEHYRTLFADVVRRMSRSFERLACEVSGGLDSSAIFAVAEHLRRQQKLLAPGIDGYTLDFRDDSDANELDYSHLVGDYLNSSIHEIPPSLMPLRWYHEWARRYREFPSYPNGIMGLGIRKQAANQGSRVLLVGVGGDEWLGGSRRYYAEALAEKQWKSFFTYLEMDRREVGLLPSLWWVFRHGCYPLLPESARRLLRKMISERQRTSWLTPAMDQLLRRRHHQYCRSGISRTRRVGQRAMNLSLSGGYQAHARELEERMAASVGIELRRPFFDYQMVQFAFSTPEHLRLRGRTNKFLHRKAMVGMLPKPILERDTKASFGVTFTTHLSEMSKYFSIDAPRRMSTWLEAQKVKSYYANINNKNNFTPELMLWTLFGCDALLLGYNENSL